MTQNKRIFVNTVASYGRSLLGVACGIFTARWVLESLGQQDFGLYAVIGSMALVMSYLNIQFAGAISRFYAFAVGQAKISGNEDAGLKECRSWFTVAVLVHTTFPVFLVAIGWPLGIYAIHTEWIQIPPDRIDACCWLWRFACISSLCSMVNVPFQAMYTAKQYIAELTIYSVVQTILRTAFIFYMTMVKKDWLVEYGAVMAAVIVIPQIVICFRAISVFKECRIEWPALREVSRIWQLANYAVWTAVGGLGYLASHQCMSILLNNSFGAKVVAGFGVSQTVSSEAASLTGSLQTAFQPAITTAYGAQDIRGMKQLSYNVCKIGTLLTLIFAIPMAVEIDELLSLWLRNPPPYSSEMCLSMLAFIVIEKLSIGHQMAVNASGKIARFQVVRGLLRASVLPLAILPAWIGLGPAVTSVALPLSVVIVVVGDVILAKSRVGLDGTYWLRSVVVPLIIVVATGVGVGCLPRFFMEPSFARLCATTCLILVSLIPLSWSCVLAKEEREFVQAKILSRFKRVK